MCTPASFVLTKDNVFWSSMSESHEDCINEHGLKELDMFELNILRVEISPPREDYTLPLDKWVFRMDQDLLPEWARCEGGLASAEVRARAALPDWLAQKVVLPGAARYDVKKHLVAVYGAVTGLRDATIDRVCGEQAIVENVRGKSTIYFVTGAAKINDASDSSVICDVRDQAVVSCVRGRALIKLVCGKATIRNVAGSAMVYCVEEDASIRNVSGHAKVQYVGGRVVIENVEDSVIIQSVTQQATVRHVRGHAVISQVCSSEVKIENVGGCATILSSQNLGPGKFLSEQAVLVDRSGRRPVCYFG